MNLNPEILEKLLVVMRLMTRGRRSLAEPNLDDAINELRELVKGESEPGVCPKCKGLGRITSPINSVPGLEECPVCKLVKGGEKTCGLTQEKSTATDNPPSDVQAEGRGDMPTQLEGYQAAFRIINDMLREAQARLTSKPSYKFQRLSAYKHGFCDGLLAAYSQKALGEFPTYGENPRIIKDTKQEAGK